MLGEFSNKTMCDAPTSACGADGRSPKVSILMPLYNHERYVGEAIDSVLKQSFTDFELIIVNDGSSDESESVVKKIRDDRIRYFSQENQGASYTINRCIQLARGAYVSILNSDDAYDHRRIEECMKVLHSEPGLSAVFSHVALIDTEGAITKHIRNPQDIWPSLSRTSDASNGDIVLNLLAGNFLLTTSNLFCRRKVFDEIGYFRNLKFTHDYDFFLRLCSAHAAKIIEEPLLKYRIHPANTIKKDEAAVSFEIGLTLTRFFLHNDVLKVIGKQKELQEALALLLDGVNTHRSERLIMGLLLGARYDSEKFIESLANGDHILRRSYIDRYNSELEERERQQEGWNMWKEANDKLLQKHSELQSVNLKLEETWNNAQKAWSQWKETNDCLRETNDRFLAANELLAETQKDLREVNQTCVELRNSLSYRVGRNLLRPIKKWLGKGWE